jgi:hypothetical protein
LHGFHNFYIIFTEYMNKFFSKENTIVFVLLFSQFLSQAQIRKYSNEFLNIGVGARGLAMSRAYISTVNDVTAGYWNPAGILGISGDIQVSAMHAEYFAGIAKYDYAGIGKALDSSNAIAFSFLRFGVDNIPNTTQLIDAQGNLNYDRITSFSAADYAFLFTYARRTKIPGLQLGGNFKVIYRGVGDFATAWGFGLDAGVKYQIKKINLAATARDITTTVTAWNYTIDDATKEVFRQTENEIPVNGLEISAPSVTIGASTLFQIRKLTINPEVNVDFTFDGKRNVLFSGKPVSGDPAIGCEFGFMNIVFLRAGIGNFQRVINYRNTTDIILQPNMGVGLKIKRISIDYALTDIGDQSAALFSNIFSLKFDIIKKTL